MGLSLSMEAELVEAHILNKSTLLIIGISTSSMTIKLVTEPVEVSTNTSIQQLTIQQLNNSTTKQFNN
jgi:hypothetical protein